MAVTRDPNAGAIGSYQIATGTSATITISTTNPSVIVLDFTDQTSNSTAVPTSAHLTWVHHADGSPASGSIRRFYAIASSALTNEVITIGTIASFSRGTASAYNGVNTSSPWDSGGPVTSAGPDPLNITIANAVTMLYAYFTCTTPTNPGTSWSTVHTASGDFAIAEDQATTVTGTYSASLGTGGTGTASGIIVDALVASGGGLTGSAQLIMM